MTTIIYTCSVSHASTNFPQYEEYGFPPNYPGMLRGIPPKNKVGLVLRDRQIEGERDTDKRHTDRQRKDRKILNLSSVNSVVPFCLVD